MLAVYFSLVAFVFEKPLNLFRSLLHLQYILRMYEVNKAFFKAISRPFAKSCFLYVILETHDLFFSLSLFLTK